MPVPRLSKKTIVLVTSLLVSVLLAGVVGSLIKADKDRFTEVVSPIDSYFIQRWKKELYKLFKTNFGKSKRHVSKLE